MRLLVFNLVTDRDDPILGFATSWVEAIAAACDRVDVVTMRAGRYDLPENVAVFSAGKERGYSEPRRVLEFYRALGSLLRTNRYDGCFAHMMPLFAAMGAPLLKAAGVPVILWYAHPSLTPTLRIAHRLSDRVVTSIPGAYPYRTDKLLAIGQGIDTRVFSPAPEETDSAEQVIVCAGRLAPVKDHPTLLRAVRLLTAAGRVVRLKIVGGGGTASDQAYIADLQSLAERLGLAEITEFAGAVPVPGTAEWYRRAVVHVNLTPRGFGDKVALEAMACGCPSIVANSGFRETLGKYADLLMFRPSDPSDLASRLGNILDLEVAERKAVGGYLRAQVQRLHSLDRLADRIVSLSRELNPVPRAA